MNPADWPQQATNDGLTSSTVGTGRGDVLSQTIQNQAGTVTYNIDQAGRDNQIGVLSMGSTTPLTTTYAFNDNEQMTGVALPNNVEQDAGYDGANRLTSLSAQNTANHTLLNNLYQYGYDPLGLTTAITTTVQGSPSSQSLSHDAAGRLTAITGTAPTGSWSYDGRGNLSSATNSGVTTSYSYSTSNPEELASTSISGQPTIYYGYDGAGDTTSITNTSSLNRQLSYDAQTRLTQITFGSPITQTVVITYNVFGQRANYAVTPSGAGQPSLSEHFWYQGDQVSQVAYTGTSITTPYTDTYVYSQDGAPLELLRQQGASVTPYWYVLDGQGNVVALTNQSGAVVDSYTYDQWGKPLTVSESVPQQLRYAGSWYDNELGWYWLSVRSYDPTLERFLQPDPSEQEGLFNYIYGG
ncbi:MAG TPA: RHS repeat-associated core domain-containing protein, partial [Candidatus Dormibacteraeota bacterium]|nr:RHS repeat-associated core domain-containing protein [Candidatus Dormibacteraeota bacterium]